MRPADEPGMSLKNAIAADRRGNTLIAKALKTGPLTATSTGEAVKAAERMLKLAGYDVGAVDGKFDAKSLAALEKLDAATGNAADGAFDQSSFDTLKGIQARVRKHHGDTFLGQGQAGATVKAAEQRLARLGYDVGAADGVFDAKTAAAVKAFKRDEGMKRDPSFLGDRSVKALRAEVNGLAHAPYRGRVVKNHKEHRRLDAATAAAAKSGIAAGANVRVVKNVQAHLRSAGFDPGIADGKFDGRTEAMVRQFQTKAGLPVTGEVNERTWRQLEKARFLAKTGTSPSQRLGEKSASVAHTEKILRKLGYKNVKADGIFDRETLKASRAFEKRFPGMGSDGAVGAGQLERMKQVLRAKENPGSGPTVKKGYSGNPVRQLEARLDQLGFFGGKADRKFTAGTARAVRRFQKAFGLEADGVVGKKTWRMLGVDAKGAVSPPGIGGTAFGRKLVSASKGVAMSMGGYSSQGLCATGVSRALAQLGVSVYGNGNQIDNNLPRDKFKQINVSLAQALKIPGAIITWERTSTALGSRFGHVAVSWGNGRTTSSDFIESNTTGAGRSGMKVFVPR
ncbi:MAG: peptidoglycan-binding protein [Myxococcaceae bacterium]|nr:peptidoglycan-binding protein [Myxococcaceae bacterium]